MKKSAHIPPRGEISIDAPLRLDVAAALAYPDGSMTASGLRREAARGRLVIERTAGKDYTTLRNIERMRELCRVEAKDPASGCAAHNTTAADVLPTQPYGLSRTANTGKARDAALMIVGELKQRSPATSAANTSPKRKRASVLPLTSR
jgi:hypothetical protein